MGRGAADSFYAVDSLRPHGIKPDLLGVVCCVRVVVLCFSRIRSSISVATGRSSRSDVVAVAGNCVGVHHLLCRRNDRLFEIRVYPPDRLFDPDSVLFDRGSVAHVEANLMLASEAVLE